MVREHSVECFRHLTAKMYSGLYTAGKISCCYSLRLQPGRSTVSGSKLAKAGTREHPILLIIAGSDDSEHTLSLQPAQRHVKDSVRSIRPSLVDGVSSFSPRTAPSGLRRVIRYTVLFGHFCGKVRSLEARRLLPS